MQYITYEDYLKYISTVIIKEEGEKYQFEKNSKKEEKYNKEKIEKIDKVHDKTLKIVLNIKREVIKLLKGFLEIQEEIKEEEIEEYPTEFITKNYKEKRTDIIYKIKERPVYFLIEHQSTEDKEMIERIGIYVQEIMRKAKVRGKYPIVVPIVIYTGYKRWKAKTIFSEKQYKEKRYEEYELNLKYNLISMQDYTYEELLKKGTLFSSVLILEKCRTEEELEERLEEIIEKTKDKKDKEILEQIIKNVLQPQFGKEKTEKILEKMKEGRRVGMSPLTKCFLI